MTHPGRHLLPPTRGVSLTVVLIVVVLGLISIAGAFRVARLSESQSGATADHARTYAAAEALLRDAESDIRGRLPDTTGTWAANGDVYKVNATDGLVGLPCKTAVPPANKVYAGCRTIDAVPGATNDAAWYPESVDEYDELRDVITAKKPTLRCYQGICTPLSMADLRDIHLESLLSPLFPDGAYYGQYTGLKTKTTTNSNPSLSRNTTATTLPAAGQPWGRYWVEVFRHTNSVANGSSASTNLVPDPSAPFVYRVTAVAQGLKPGSRVILRQVFVPNPAAQNP